MNDFISDFLIVRLILYPCISQYNTYEELKKSDSLDDAVIMLLETFCID